MVETGGLEDRYTRKCFGGSSPLPSTNSFRLPCGERPGDNREGRGHDVVGIGFRDRVLVPRGGLLDRRVVETGGHQRGGAPAARR